MRKYLLTCLLIYLGCLRLWAQQPAYFMMGEEQFEGVQIYDVTQDLQSNYWFATDEGIYKHDGYGFERIDCPGMVGLSAFGFVMNDQGTLFCHNLNYQVIKIQDGTCTVMYELKEDERAPDIHLAVTPDNLLLVVAKKALLINPNNQVIARSHLSENYYAGVPFLTQQGTFICHLNGHDSILEISGTRFEIVAIQHPEPNIEGLLRFFRNQGRSFAINVGSKMLYTLDEQTYRLEPMGTPPYLQPLEFERFYNLGEQLWIANSISGVRLMRDYQQQSADIWYPEYLISKAFRDQEGNLLLTTFNHGIVVIPDPSIPDALPIPGGQLVMGLANDENLGLLLGTATGQLLAMQHNQITPISMTGTKPLEAIHTWPWHPLILFDDGKLKAYDKQSGKINTIGQGSLKDAVALDTSTLYLALNIGMYKITWDRKAGFKQTEIEQLKMRCYAIALDDRDHSIYVATANGMKMLSQDGTVSDLLFKGQRIFADDLTYGEGILYMATKNQGLLLLQRGKPITSIQPQLAGKRLEFSRLLLSDGQLYATTSAGMIVLHPAMGTYAQLNKANGIGTSRIFDFALHDNQLWLAQTKGLQHLSLQALQQEVPTPKILLTEVSVNDEPLQEIGSRTAFDYSQRKFRFQVSSPTLRYRESITYHYQLQGYENRWMTAPYSEHNITYNALGPGEYTFQVKAEHQGKMSQTVSYAFSISAPLYARWWFILALALLVLASVTLVYMRQLSVQRRKASMLNELNLSRLTAIQSQMNPHFIFNALNSIQDLVLQGDIDNSYTFITKFANLVRRTLNYSDKDFIEFEEEIELLELYLALEKLRFKHDFEYILHTEGIDGIQVPPMLVQPFVENALIHGLIHKLGPKRLDIHFELGETLVCTILDNGVGRAKAREIKARQQAAAEPFASAAMHKRFAILNAHFQGQLGFIYEDLMEDGLPCGTKVTLHIPVKHQF